MTSDDASVAPTSAELANLLRVIYALPPLVKDTRTRLGLTQRDVAEVAGVSSGLVQRLEKGDVSLRVTTVTRLLTWLTVALDQPTPVRVPGRRPPPFG